MKKIKVLAPWHSIPDNLSYYTSIINNIVKELEKSNEVEIFWLISMPSTFEKFEKNNHFILDIHCFKNGLDVIEKIQPDIVLASASPNLIDYACSIAGKFSGIPVISGFYNSFSTDPIGLKTHTKLFFSNDVSTDLNKTEKKFMKRGRFFLYKLWFVLKTQLSVNMSLKKIVFMLIIILKHHLRYEPQTMDSRFANDLHWITGEELSTMLIKNGFKKSSIILSGDPMLDEIYKNSKIEKLNSSSEKIVILLAPSTAYEHGLCSKSEQFNVIKNILNEFLKNKDSFEIIVKIHPSSASLSEYSKFIKKINPNVSVFQKESIFDLMNNSDLVITFPLTTVNIISIILKKPVIVYNFLNIKNDNFINEKIGFECSDVSNLVNLTKEILSKSNNDYNLNKYVQKYYYKLDGNSSKRIANSISKILDQKNF